ncbi:MAG: FG-GAP-like repeat-containing protein [Gemmatimonadota bacterium]|nr:FG-GAP-like repeat-containing protein [Gemmatimonadota bacterium]
MTPPGPRRASLLGLVVLAACAGPDFEAVEQPTEWSEGDGFRWRGLAVAAEDGVGFTPVPFDWSGIDFRNRLGREALAENQMRTNGSGVALGDIDGDGLTDVYLSRLDGANALYRNLGDWRFEEVAEAAGVRLEGRFSTGATFVDVEGDGDADLVVTSLGGGKGIYLNDGSGSFADGPSLGPATGAMSIAASDIDGDGDVDLYLTNYKRESVLDLFRPEERTFERTVRETELGFEVVPEFADHYQLVWGGGEVRRLELGEPDELFLNDGAGGFSPAKAAETFGFADGTRPDALPRDWGLAARFGDLDRDGDPDLYVANDLHTPDRVWLNDGGGTFTALERGRMPTTSASTMAVDFSDLDRDGDLDVLTVDMLSRSSRLRKTQDPVARVERGLPGEDTGTQQVARNTLLIRRDDGTYPEIGRFAGIEASDWSWAVQSLDVDLDGYEDLLIPNGHILDLMDADTQVRLQRAFIGDWAETSLFFEPLPLRNVAFRNRGDLTFEEVGATWSFGAEADISHGLALGDLDGDGDLDVVVNRLDAPALVLRNDASAPRLAVRLRGSDANTAGLGGWITVTAPGLPVQSSEVVGGGGYLSGSTPLATFAMPDHGEARIEVKWRDGSVSVVQSAQPNRLYEIDQTGAVATSPGAESTLEGPPPVTPLFERVAFGGLHDEPVFDDFARQPLLPLRLSQMGPQLGWHDLDADGDADLVVTAGAGSPPALYRNDDGTLRRVGLGGPEVPVDQSGVIPLPDGRGRARILIGLSGYEAPEGDRMAMPSLIGVDLEAGSFAGSTARAGLVGLAPGDESAVGPIAASDVDLDGLLDVFIGGRVKPGRYPEGASSRLLLGRRDGSFVPDQGAAAVLDGVGLVSGAVFTDYDVDGDPDLILAIEWGPLRVLRNDSGRLVDATDELGLGALTSRWNAVTAGDLNGDGRPDLVATSWGRNTEYRATADSPLLAYFEDVDRNGTLDVIEARYDERLGGVAPLGGFQRMAGALPGLAARLETHAAYADATVKEALGDEPRAVVSASSLAHLVLWNRGDRFEAAELPEETQWAPALAALIADADGDGRDDVFVAQNFFATDEDSPRYDAGQGIWLRVVDGDSFEVLESDRSGVRLNGDQRGPAVADLDGDARIDLAVGQNGGAVALYRNVGAAPGLRVRLEGPPTNPYVVGASVRVVYSDGFGPRREIRAGSGVGSHDDPVQVLGLSGVPVGVEVTWPGGRVETVDVDADALAAGRRDVVVIAPGVADGRG